jgi:hypothetical protein
MGGAVDLAQPSGDMVIYQSDRSGWERCNEDPAERSAMRFRALEHSDARARTALDPARHATTCRSRFLIVSASGLSKVGILSNSTD